MPDLSSLVAFALIALGMVLTPGPNMIYIISRSITQGRVAGMISLGGVVLGFIVYMLCAAFGITALVMAVPYAYDALRFGGALYLSGALIMAFNVTMTILGHQRDEEPVTGSIPALQPAE